MIPARPEHQAIREILTLLDADLFETFGAWFGGGTAIVLQQGEYRVSRDLDFLCSSADGYRELRIRAVRQGVRAFFRNPVDELRPFRCDQYGIRAVLGLHGQPIKFEIVREARITVSGVRDASLGCGVLSPADQFAEKLLANADRCQDRSVASRDAIDLGMLIRGRGPIPAEAVTKAEAAYGPDIRDKLRWIVAAMANANALARAAATLEMPLSLAQDAMAAVAAEAARIWP
jgi:hypothetical protein